MEPSRKSRFFVREDGIWVNLLYLELKPNGRVWAHYKDFKERLINNGLYYGTDKDLNYDTSLGIIREIMKEELALII